MKLLKLFFYTSIYCQLVIGLIACSGIKTENTEQKTIKVKTITVATSAGSCQREYVGVVESESSVDLSFLVSGSIARMYVQEGQSVQKGELLAQLNTTTFEHIHKAAKATLDQAKDALDRMSALYNNNSLPEIKYIEIKTTFEQAQANEQIARKSLADCSLYAPFSGVIGRRTQDVGTTAMPGIAVMTLMNISTVKVKIPVPESDISSIRLQEPCRVKISALNDAVFEGKVIEKGVVAHPISHTYDIKVQINNAKADIMPGMVCKAYLENKNQTGGIVVPLKVVQIDFSGNNYVWVVGKGNKAECRNVRVGALTGNGIHCTEGLNDGDILIIEGYQKLSPGEEVKAIQ